MKKDSDERLPRIVQSGDLPLHEQSNPCLHGIIMDLKTMMIMMMMIFCIIFLTPSFHSVFFVLQFLSPMPILFVMSSNCLQIVDLVSHITKMYYKIDDFLLKILSYKT